MPASPKGAENQASRWYPRRSWASSAGWRSQSSKGSSPGRAGCGSSCIVSLSSRFHIRGQVTKVPASAQSLPLKRGEAKGLPSPVVAGTAILAATTEDVTQELRPGDVTTGRKSKFKKDDCTGCADPVVAVTPGAVWTTADEVLGRIDAGSRETTLELSLEELASATP